MGSGRDDGLHGGTGNELLTGGTGADQFLLQTAGGTDRIADFTDGIDRIVIHSEADTFHQIRIADPGTDARISFADVTIILSNVDHARLGAEDFIFT